MMPTLRLVGTLLFLLGVVAAIEPLPRLRLRTSLAGVLLALAGAALVVLSGEIKAPTMPARMRVPTPVPVHLAPRV